MKPQDTKLKFIQMRAERKSFDTIARELGISKSTCTAWEQECKEAIAELKANQLEELYTAYSMNKEARIKELGNTLDNINKALAAADLEAMSPEKLLDFKLKYTEALKEEYIATGNSFSSLKGDKPVTAKDIVAAFTDLLERVQAGEMTAEQSNRETAVLLNLLKAYDTVEVKAKLEALETILGGR